MGKARRNYQTQWAGQFGAAHELARRGYLVTFTTGNAPGTDLLCESPGRVLFKVQVKSVSGKNAFICQRSLLKPDDKLFLIFVSLPPPLREHPRYFILNHEQFLRVIAAQDRYAQEKTKRTGKTYADFPYSGFLYSVLEKFDFCDAWENLPV